MMRAGDCVGTPDWQLDLMIQNQNERAWEKLNAIPEINQEQVLKMLSTAIRDVEDASESVFSVSEEADGTFIGSSLYELYNKLDTIWYELRQIEKEVKE